MIKRILLLLILFTCCIAMPTFAQKWTISSMDEYYSQQIQFQNKQQAEKALDVLSTEIKKLDSDSLTIHLGFLTGANTARFNIDNGIPLIDKAIDDAEKNNLPTQAMQYIASKGYCYEQVNNYPLAIEYLLKAISIKEKEKLPANKPYIYAINNLADVYYKIGNYDEALRYLLRAQNDIKKLNVNVVTLTNTTAMCYEQINKSDSALYYFKQALQYATDTKDTIWIGITSGNIGGLYVKRNQYALALPYVETEYKYSVKYNEAGSIVASLILLANIAISQNKPADAIAKLDEATTRLDLKLINNYDRQGPLFLAYSKAYAQLNNFPKAYGYSVKMIEVQDSIARRRNVADYSRIKIQIETERHLNDLRIADERRQKEVNRRNYFIVVISLGAVIILLLYNRQRLKRKRDKEHFEHKVELHKAELTRAAEELHSYIKNIAEKNDLIAGFKDELEKLKQDNESYNAAEGDIYIDKLVNASILTGQDWASFKIMFDKVHPRFFNRLADKYPDLTPAETRLCALIKLNLPGKEMAAMLGISTDSVKKAKTRLRKKINLPEDAGLESVIEGI